MDLVHTVFYPVIHIIAPEVKLNGAERHNEPESSLNVSLCHCKGVFLCERLSLLMQEPLQKCWLLQM